MKLKWSNFQISNVKIGIIFMSAFAFCYGANSTYIGAMITTLEKRFELNSMEVGLLLGANNIGYLSCVVFVAYFGSRNGREPIMLCLSAIGLWMSSMVYTLPYAIFGPKHSVDELMNLNISNSKQSSVCGGSRFNLTSDIASNDITKQEKSIAMFILMMAGIINGVATTPFWNLGLSFIDDMAGPKNSGLYIGILYGTQSFAPMMGFIIGSQVLKLHESLSLHVSQYSPGQKDIRWIGAWWFGWLTLGFAVLLTAPFLALLRAKKSMKKTDSKEKNILFLGADPIDKKKESFLSNTIEGLKELFSILKESIQNKVYVTMILGMILGIVSFVCLFSFFTKFLEFHFKVSASAANIFTALSIGGSSVLGAIISGVISHVFKIGIRNMNRFHAIVNSLSALCFPILFIFTCSTSEIAGVTEESKKGICSNDCLCPMKNLKPICVENVTYFSPCLAGCLKQINNTYYSNCGCGHSMLAKKGFCEQMCPSVYGFLIAFFIIRLIGSIASVQFTQILMRLTEPKNKAVYMSTISFIYGVTGFIMPPLSGILLDTACKIRNVNKNGMSSHCLIYNNDKLRYIIIGFAFALQIPASILYIMSWLFTPEDYHYKRKSIDVSKFKSSINTKEETF